MPKSPGGPMADWNFFQPAVESGENGQQKQIGTNAPDGKFYHFNDGEELVLIKEGNTRQPFIRLKSGAQIPFKQWKEEVHDIQKKKDPLEELVGRLNREQLNNITKTSSRQGALFGREISLTLSDKEQIGLVAKIGEEVIKPLKADPLWKKLHETIASHTELISFIFPPHWLIDAGDQTDIQVRQGQKGTYISVPSRIYQLYGLNKTVDSLNDIKTRDEKNWKGTSADYLGKNMALLGKFLRERGVIGKK